MSRPPGRSPRRGAFAHPLAGAAFSAARAAVRRGGGVGAGALGPLTASAIGTWKRRAWIGKAREAAAAVPDDWHETAPPIFVVGFWRSGTTLLHELLAADPAFAAPSLIDVLCPADAPFLLADKRAMVGRLLPPDRGFDAVELAPDRPQEEEWALANMGAPSFFNAFYFPRRRAALIDEALFFEGPGNPCEDWRAAHQAFLRMLTAKYPGRRLVLKNPANSTRLADLRALYPKARFVRIDRPRQAVLPSLTRMMDGLAGLFSLQGAPEPFGEAEAARLHERVTETLDDQWRRIPRDLRFAVSYERLVEHPMRTVERIYEALGLELTPGARARQLRFWLRQGRGRKAFAAAAGRVAAGDITSGSGP